MQFTRLHEFNFVTYIALLGVSNISFGTFSSLKPLQVVKLLSDTV